ncbi:MOSC domain-containing protein [Paenibacillus humicus]|uniref:MOSC domain-containing protein n=1 Tax=Paenibacillus humicus TaxID=412861 RepID=UPI000FD732BB|nr:MOSC N-terminal beta barrel domain-containing protein [Paenibacillus humicus]
METSSGKVSSIMRYPVKSFAGERLDACEMEASGLAGDRIGAFRDQTKQGWSSYITARQIPAMLSYEASVKDDILHIVSPEGRSLRWDGELLADMQRHAKIELSMTGYKAPHLEEPGLLAVDAAPVLIVTDASRRKLEAAWGKELDIRRFRPNLVLAMNDPAFDDEQWIGRRLRIGTAELRVDSFCGRCSMIGLEPDTLQPDPSLHKTVSRQFGNHFGLYASVSVPGAIRIGDDVYEI